MNTSTSSLPPPPHPAHFLTFRISLSHFSSCLVNITITLIVVLGSISCEIKRSECFQCVWIYICGSCDLQVPAFILSRRLCFKFGVTLFGLFDQEQSVKWRDGGRKRTSWVKDLAIDARQKIKMVVIVAVAKTAIVANVATAVVVAMAGVRR